MKQILILLISVILFSCSNGDKRYHISETENKGSEENPIIFHNDKLCNGIIYTNYENGQLKGEGKYQNGNKIGEHKSWYENGELKSLDILIDGKKSGICRIWYENGQLMFEGQYKDGEMDGLFITYSEMGEKISEFSISP